MGHNTYLENCVKLVYLLFSPSSPSRLIDQKIDHMVIDEVTVFVTLQILVLAKFSKIHLFII